MWAAHSLSFCPKPSPDVCSWTYPMFEGKTRRKVCRALGRWWRVQWVRSAWCLLSHGRGLVGEVSLAKKWRSRYKPRHLLEGVCIRRRNAGKSSQEEPGRNSTPLSPPSLDPQGESISQLTLRLGVARTQFSESWMKVMVPHPAWLIKPPQIVLLHSLFPSTEWMRNAPADLELMCWELQSLHHPESSILPTLSYLSRNPYLMSIRWFKNKFLCIWAMMYFWVDLSVAKIRLQGTKREICLKHRTKNGLGQYL